MGMLDFNAALFPGYHHRTTLSDAKEFDADSGKEAAKCKVCTCAYVCVSVCVCVRVCVCMCVCVYV